MKEQMDKLLSRGMWCSIILFALRCLYSKDEIINGLSIYNLWGFAGEAIGLAAILMIAYEKWIWRWDPLIKVPNINGIYKGHFTSD